MSECKWRHNQGVAPTACLDPWPPRVRRELKREANAARAAEDKARRELADMSAQQLPKVRCGASVSRDEGERPGTHLSCGASEFASP